MQVEIDALRPGEVKERTPAKPQRQTYYARRYGQQSMGGSRLVGSLQVMDNAVTLFQDPYYNSMFVMTIHFVMLSLQHMLMTMMVSRYDQPPSCW